LAKLKIGRLAGMELTAEARDVVDEVSGAIELGLTEARQAVMALRTAPDSEDSFANLMGRCVDEFQDRFGLQVEFECTGDPPTMPVRTQAELLRIAQEALANARRHADATVVRIQVAFQDGRIRMSVVDNGRGFDRTEVGPNSFGLAAMRERAALIDAELDIRSAPGEGTRVQVLAPLPTVAMRPRLEMT
jgi:signal transduction histidine kinase